jgi:hypothetical protein
MMQSAASDPENAGATPFLAIKLHAVFASLERIAEYPIRRDKSAVGTPLCIDIAGC